LAAGDNSKVMFTHNLDAKLTLSSLDAARGRLELKLGKKSLNEKFGGAFPQEGSLLPHEHISSAVIQAALAEVAARHLSDELPSPVAALLNRRPPPGLIGQSGESSTDIAIRVAGAMSGDCLVIQGPPGTGKTYTASRVIASLLAAGRKIGVASNSHKAVVNLLLACGDAVRGNGGRLQGVKVGGEADGPLFTDNPDVHHAPDSGAAQASYRGGVIGGTAWLFTRPRMGRRARLSLYR
jgi:hypothetical protein